MDNDKKLFEELLKADGIDPANITESERIVFRQMLESEKKHVKRLSWISVGALWIYALAVLGLCLYEKIMETLRIPFIVACIGVMAVMCYVFIVRFPRHNRKLRQSNKKISKLYYLAHGKHRGIAMVSRKDGKRVIHWMRLLILTSVLWLFSSLVGAGVYYLLCRIWMPTSLLFIVTSQSLIFVTILLVAGLRAQIEELDELKVNHKKSKLGTAWTDIPRIIMKSKITKFAALTVMIIAVFIGINQFAGPIDGSSVAFGKALEYFQSLNYSFDLTIEPVPPSPNDAPINAKATVLSSKKYQMNWSDEEFGDVSAIVDYEAKKFLQLFHDHKVGRISSYDGQAKGDLSLMYSAPAEMLWNLKDGHEQQLDKNKLHGQNAVGFKVIYGDFEIEIWADANSGLPLYVTAVSKPIYNAIAAKWVMQNFDFELEPNAVLFSIEGPPDYTIVDSAGMVIRQSATEPKETRQEQAVNDDKAQKFLISPLEGIGPVKFGMSPEQVIEQLGQPDQVLNKHCLDYSSTLGLSLLVHPQRGLLLVDCWSRSEKSSEGILCGADFMGKTSSGVGINSTRNDVIRQFGNEFKESLAKPPATFAMQYPKLNMIIELRNKKVTHISLDAQN